MKGDFQEYVMPSGERCYYRERDHSYWKLIEPKSNKFPAGEWKGKERLTGVSTCSGGLEFDPTLLLRWAARVTMEGVSTLTAPLLADNEDWNRLDLAWLSNEKTIWHQLERHGLTYDQIREQRATEGTNVHEYALHALAKGAAVPAYAQLSQAERGYAKGVVQFWLDHNPKPLQAEQVVCSHSLGVAGRLDLRYETEARDKIVTLDCKTSGYIGNAAHVQVAGYDFLAAACGFGLSDERMILQVSEDGKYELIPVKATREDFYCAVEAYRRSKRIKKEANADRKAREDGRNKRARSSV